MNRFSYPTTSDFENGKNHRSAGRSRTARLWSSSTSITCRSINQSIHQSQKIHRRWCSGIRIQWTERRTTDIANGGGAKCNQMNECTDVGRYVGMHVRIYVCMYAGIYVCVVCARMYVLINLSVSLWRIRRLADMTINLLIVYLSLSIYLFTQ